MDSGFESRSRTQLSICCLLSQGPSLEGSSLILVPPPMANPQLLPILEFDTHVDAGYVSNEFCESYFEDLVDYNKLRFHYSLGGN